MKKKELNKINALINSAFLLNSEAKYSIHEVVGS